MNDSELLEGADFRPFSKARRVAEMLLTGRRYSRQALAQVAEVSESTVNRVVGKLEEQGVEFTKLAEGRRVVFQRVIPKPAVPAPRTPRPDARERVLEAIGAAPPPKVEVENPRFREWVERGATWLCAEEHDADAIPCIDHVLDAHRIGLEAGTTS